MYFQNEMLCSQMDYINKMLIVFLLISLKNVEFVTFVFWNVRLKPRYFKCPWSDFYDNWHVFPGNIVPTYSSVNFKFESTVFKKIQIQKSRRKKSH